MLEQNLKPVVRTFAASLCLALGAVLLSGGQAPAAENWNFYMRTSRRRSSRASRGAKLFTEEIDKATGGELKVRLHLAGTLQINASNITQAVGGNNVQIGDDLFNSETSRSPASCGCRCSSNPTTISLKADAVLKPYIEQAYREKARSCSPRTPYPLQFTWGRKKITPRSPTSRA